MQGLRITSEPRASPEDATFVREGLALFNAAVTGDSYYSPLAIFLRDGRGAVLGGALGHVWGGWLDLETLWVAEPFRGQGYGKKLLEAAEDEARAQGCRGVFLTTFSFQARPFYERLGYEVIADLPDYPAGHTYHVLKKMLAQSGQRPALRLSVLSLGPPDPSQRAAARERAGQSSCSTGYRNPRQRRRITA